MALADLLVLMVLMVVTVVVVLSGSVWWCGMIKFPRGKLFDGIGLGMFNVTWLWDVEQLENGDMWWDVRWNITWNLRWNITWYN